MSGRVLWATIVWEGDAKPLRTHLPAVLAQNTPPTKLLIVNSGRSQAIDACVKEVGTKSCEQAQLEENLGFNPGLNRAITEAVRGEAATGGYDWLALMTVRAIPDKAWLHEAVQVGNTSGAGMVSTLHLDPGGKVDCLGHNLSPSGAAYSFGEGLRPEQLREFLDRHSSGGEPIWCPCSGGAIYRVTALKAALELFNGELVRPRGFKSYNCDVLGYALRAAGYRHSFALQAKCRRDRTNSTSRLPHSAGLLLNQEINRVANLFEFWEEADCKAAVSRYLTEPRKTRLELNDRVIARTLGEGLARRDQFQAVRQLVRQQLHDHVALFEEVKRQRKELLGSSALQADETNKT